MRVQRTVERRQQILIDAPKIGQHVKLDVHVGQVWHEVVAHQETEEHPVVDDALEIIAELELIGSLQITLTVQKKFNSTE